MVLYHFQEEKKFGKVVWKEATPEANQPDKNETPIEGTRMARVETIKSSEDANSSLTNRQKELLGRFDNMNILVSGRIDAMKRKHLPNMKGMADKVIEDVTKKDKDLINAHVKAKSGLGLAISRQSKFLLDNKDMAYLTKKIEVCDDATKALDAKLGTAESYQAHWDAIREGLGESAGLIQLGARWDRFKMNFDKKATERRARAKEAVDKVKEDAVSRKDALISAVEEKLGGFRMAEQSFRAVFFDIYKDQPELLQTFEDDLARDMGKSSTEGTIRTHILRIPDLEQRKRLLHTYNEFRKKFGKTAFKFEQDRLSTQPKSIDATALVELPLGRHVKVSYVHFEKTTEKGTNKTVISKIPVECEAYIASVDSAGSAKKAVMHVITATGKDLSDDDKPKKIEVDPSTGKFRLVVEEEQKADEKTVMSFSDNLMGTDGTPNIKFEARA